MFAVHDGAFHHFFHEQRHGITDFVAISGEKSGNKRHISLKMRFWTVETAIKVDVKHRILGIRGRFWYNISLGILEFCEVGVMGNIRLMVF